MAAGSGPILWIADGIDGARTMHGGGAGSGKGGIGHAATEALGRLTRHDHRDAPGGGRRALVALAAIALVLAGWGVWELVA